MAEYSYRAVTRDGEAITGRIDARSESDAFEKLLAQGELPKSVTPARGEAGSGKGRTVARRRGRSSSLAQFTVQLGALIRAGVPLPRALELSGEVVAHPTLRAGILRTQKSLQEGRSFANALAESPGAFDPLYVGLARAGELSGQLGDVTESLGRYMQRMQRLKSAAVTALIYPFLLALVTIFAIVGLLVFVLPEFEALLADSAGLAWHTQGLFAISGALRSGPWIWAGAAGVIVAAVVLMRMSVAGPFFRWLSYRMPVVRDVVLKLQLARLAFTLSTSLKGGVPLLRGVELGGDVVGPGPVQAALETTAQGMRAGKSLSAGLADHAVVPAVVVATIRAGEESGRLATVFDHLAESFEAEFDETLKRALSLLEPCLILTLGVIIGGIVASVLSAVLAAQSGVL